MLLLIFALSLSGRLGANALNACRPVFALCSFDRQESVKWRGSSGFVFALVLSFLGGNIPCTTANAQQQWADSRLVGPFVCRAEFSLDTMAPLFEQLNQIEADLVRCLGIKPPKEPIELYLFRSEASYRRYLRLHYPEVPYRRALYIKSGSPGMVFAFRSRNFEVDVRHECTHSLLHASLPMVPLWLDEGLAEYFELPPERRAFDNPYLGNVRWGARFGIVPKLEKEEDKGDISEMGKSNYRNSWAWVHFMLHGPIAAQGELVAFLADIEARNPPGQLSQRLRRRIPNLERQFLAHFKSWKR